MVDLKTNFIHWYFELFQNTNFYHSMSKTTENSPWHRERTVGVHTDMVVAQYISRSPAIIWDKSDLLGALVATFHDVGKPTSEIIKFREDRGEYKAYHGHEQVSARLWEDHALTFFDDLSLLIPEFSKKDIYTVGWMIEYHVPWMIKKNDKRAYLAKTILNMLGSRYEVFLRVLLSDTYGRISDDAETKNENANNWCFEFEKLLIETSSSADNDDKPLLIVPIGAPGSGKTTIYNEVYSDFHFYSWDQLRIDLYCPNYKNDGLTDIEGYRIAFERANEDKNFKNKVNSDFIQQIKSGKNIFLDRTNITKKSRKFFINEAMRHGYKIVAEYFVMNIDLLKERSNIRTDKNVPFNVITDMFDRIQYPSYGEFNKINIR